MFESSAETPEFLQLADGTDLDADITASIFSFLFLVLDGGSDSSLPFPSCWIPELLTNGLTAEAVRSPPSQV